MLSLQGYSLQVLQDLLNPATIITATPHLFQHLFFFKPMSNVSTSPALQAWAFIEPQFTMLCEQQKQHYQALGRGR